MMTTMCRDDSLIGNDDSSNDNDNHDDGDTYAFFRQERIEDAGLRPTAGLCRAVVLRSAAVVSGIL